MGRQLRENTKKKTAISVRKAQAAAKRKKPTQQQRVTKQQLLENAIRRSLDLSSIACTDPGTLQPDEQRWLTENLPSPNNRFAYVPFRLAQLLCTKKHGGCGALYLWMQTEGMVVNGRFRPFPILAAAHGKFPPTTRVAITSVQNSRQDFLSFEQAGVAWVPLHLHGLPHDNGDNNSNTKIFVLQTVDAQLYGQLETNGWILPVLKGGDVENEQPNLIGVVTMQYNNVTLHWDHQNDGKFREVFDDYQAEEDDEPLSDTAKAEIRRLLGEEKHRLEAEAMAKVERNRQDFAAMVDGIAAQHQTTRDDILDHLDNRLRLYKLYPTRLPEPEPTAFGPSGGVEKTALINRFCTAAQYFVS